ncbi:MAG: M20/M25/M40 family metallo-hydrolase [Gemmatimonadales bacterium]
MLANLWLTRPLVARQVQASPLGAALLHTTTSPTMLSAGIKDNVLPPEATAVVNFRIKPGETAASVTERVRSVIADTQVTVGPLDSAVVDPSPVSDTESNAYRLLVETIRGLAPGEQLPVLPYLVMGGTDAKYWGAHSDRVFRFLTIPLGNGDLARIHGVNERVPVKDYAGAVGFFSRLLQSLDRL